jgi:protease I
MRMSVALTVMFLAGLTLRAESEDRVLLAISKRDFSDEELFVSKEILEYSGYKVDFVSSSKGTCYSIRGRKIEALENFSSVDILNYKALILIGGLKVKEYWDDQDLMSLVRAAFEENMILAAISAAPVVFANAGILEGRKATVSEVFKEILIDKGAIYTGSGVEVDANIITAGGTSSSEGFGCRIVELLENR